MTTYYVATLAQCVIVEADNEDQARERGEQAIADFGTQPADPHSHYPPGHQRRNRIRPLAPRAVGPRTELGSLRHFLSPRPGTCRGFLVGVDSFDFAHM